jgi:RNA polymerase primary sigma factor
MPDNLPEPIPLELASAEKLYNELRTIDLTKLRFEPGDPVGMYWNEIKKVKPLTPEEEPEVLARYIGGDPEDKRELCERNLWLAFLIAFKYQDSGHQMLDLISEGNFGLIRAVEEYDPASGYKFNVFATWRINQEILHNPSEKITVREHLRQSENMEEANSELGPTRERVPSIPQNQVRKLRYPRSTKQLKDYL